MTTTDGVVTAAMMRGLSTSQADEVTVEHGGRAGSAIDLTRATVPAHVVSGGRDLDHFALVAHSLAQRLRNVDRTVLPWAGHLPNLERPDEVNALLLDVHG